MTARLRWSLNHRRVILGCSSPASLASGRAVLDHAAGFPAQRRYRPAAGPDPGRQRHLVRPDGRPICSEVAAHRQRRSQCRGRAGADAGRQRHRRHQSARVIDDHRPEAAAAAQARRRRDHPRAAAASSPAFPASTSSSPIRPPSASAARGSRSNYQYTLQGLDLDELQDVSDRLMDAMLQDDARLCRRHQRSRRGDAVGAGQDRPRPRRRAGRHAAADRDRAGLRPLAASRSRRSTRSSNQYQVILELLPQYPARCRRAVDRLYITATNGTLVPLTAVTTIDRQHRCRSASIIPARLPAVTDFLRPGARARRCQRRGHRRSARPARRSACRTPSRAASRAPRRPSRVRPRIWACC